MFQERDRGTVLLMLRISNLISSIFTAGNYLVKMRVVNICKDSKYLNQDRADFQ